MPDKAVCDVDDLWCEEQILRWLAPLHEALPQFCLTCYSIPNKLGPVFDLRARYPWITFAIHGWEHSQFETRAWTDTLAKSLMQQALEMGYAPLFKAPNWLEELSIEEPCRDLGLVLHHHPRYQPTTIGLQVYPGPKPSHDFESVHTHIQANPATDSIDSCPHFSPSYLSKFASFHTPIEMAVEIK